MCVGMRTLEYPFMEGIFESIVLKLNLKDKAIILANFYRPPKGSMTEFQNLFPIFLDFLSSFDLPVYFACDSNINLMTKEIPQKRYFDTCISNGFISLINQATRICPPSKTAIDHIFSNHPDSIITSGILVDSPSDHFFTFVTVNFKKNDRQDSSSKFRDFSLKNIENFCLDLSQNNWSRIYHTNDTETATNWFLEDFFAFFEKHFPVKSKFNNRRKFSVEKWFTKGLLKSRKRKLFLYKKWKRCGTELSKNIFVEYRNVYNKVCRAAKKKYYSAELQKTKCSSKKHWQIIKEAAGIKCEKSENVNELLDGSNNAVRNPLKIVNLFNEHFSSIGTRTAQLVPPSSVDYTQFLNVDQQTSFAFFPIGPFAIVETVNKLHDKSTKDINDISIAFLRKIIYFIAEPLSHIFEMSLSNGIFPSQLKRNKVVPVFKNAGKKNLLNNYRPITIVNCFGKILEKIVADSLLTFLYKKYLRLSV